MKRIAVWAFFAGISHFAFAGESATAPGMTAAQIVEKNVAARGGLEAWRKIQTMAWVGHIERAGSPVARMPFVLEQKRPNKTRFEIKGQNQVAVRVYDGTHGWKLRPSASGTPEVKPYTPEELAFAHDVQGIGGPLMDYVDKGIAVTLDGDDEVDGRKAYRLIVRMPSGVSHHVWVDSQSFLDIKHDRQSRNPNGQPSTMSVFYRDYQNIDGLLIPLTIETGAGGARASDKMVIDRIALNPPLEDRMFAKPRVPGGGRGSIVDTRSPPPQTRQVPWAGSTARPGTARSNLLSTPGAGGAR